jgi:hypothetical protein
MTNKVTTLPEANTKGSHALPIILGSVLGCAMFFLLLLGLISRRRRKRDLQVYHSVLDEERKRRSLDSNNIASVPPLTPIQPVVALQSYNTRQSIDGFQRAKMNAYMFKTEIRPSVDYATDATIQEPERAVTVPLSQVVVSESPKMTRDIPLREQSSNDSIPIPATFESPRLPDDSFEPTDAMQDPRVGNVIRLSELERGDFSKIKPDLRISTMSQQSEWSEFSVGPSNRDSTRSERPEPMLRLSQFLKEYSKDTFPKEDGKEKPIYTDSESGKLSTIRETSEGPQQTTSSSEYMNMEQEDTGLKSAHPSTLSSEADLNEFYRYLVITPFEPTAPEEIELRAGDEVSVWRVEKDGKCMGLNYSTNESGIFPLVNLSQVPRIEVE